MRKIFVVLFAFFISASIVFADVNISIKHRIPNDKDVGYCAWAALETLGRHHKITKLYNLVENRSKEYDYEKDGVRYKWIDYGNHKEGEPVNSGGLRAISNELKKLGVKFYYHDGYSTQLIEYAMKNNLGCVIACKAESFPTLEGAGPGTHAVVLVKFEEGDKGVAFIDSNAPEHVYYTNKAWFWKYWIGYTIVVEK